MLPLKQPLLLPLNFLMGVGAKATGSMWVVAFGVCCRSAEQDLQKRDSFKKANREADPRGGKAHMQ